MPPKRSGAMRKARPTSIKGDSSSSRPNSDVDSNNSGVGSTTYDVASNNSGVVNNNSGNNENNHNKDDTLYFIFIRSHGGLPYTQSSDISKRVKTITVPEDMNVHKITSAENGAKNCGAYVYDEKITAIKNQIKSYYKKKLETKSQETIAEEIQTLLRKEESEINTFKNTANKRTIISTKTFINKTYEKDNDLDNKKQTKIPVEVIFFQANKKNSFDIIKAHIFDEISKDKQTFDFQSIIEWLKNHGMKNVIIMDFSCSSFSNPLALNNKEIIGYLNKETLHGGMYKAKSKKTKNITKTKKLKLKTKSKSKLLQKK